MLHTSGNGPKQIEWVNKGTSPQLPLEKAEGKKDKIPVQIVTTETVQILTQLKPAAYGSQCWGTGMSENSESGDMKKELEVFHHNRENMGTSTKTSVEAQASADERSSLF